MMDPASPSLKNPNNFPNSATFVCSKSSIAILKIPDPLITITNYKPSPNKWSCKTTCSCPHSTPSKAFSTRNSPKSLNCSLNHHDFSTNPPLKINYQSNPKPKIDKNVKESDNNVNKTDNNVTKTLKSVKKTNKSVNKSTENPDKHAANSSRNSLTSCKSNPTKPNFKSKKLNGKGRKCSRKLKRLKKLNISSNNTLNSTNSTQSNSLINTNTLNTNSVNSNNINTSSVNLNNINLNKSIKVKSDKCVGTYDIEDTNLERERLNILEHLGEAESLLKFERELRFSQIRSEYSLVRDRIEEKFHLVVMCCRKRQAELNNKYIEKLDKIERRLSRIRLPTLSHIRKQLEFFN